MAVLTVGAGGTYSTIAQAVAASKSGDTVSVAPGTYENDFVTIGHSLVLEGQDGVKLVATASPPNGKAVITEGASGIDVVIIGLEISGAKVKDGNGAAVRYEGGKLTLKNVNFHDNENGLLAGSDPSGTIAIIDSTFTKNGTGTGATHNIYVNHVAQLTVEGSTITGAVVGHQIKSRAASTTITGNTIGDGEGGNASYEIDLPNGGVGTIADNVIQKGPGAQNPTAIAFGAEGNLHAASSLVVEGNTIVNNFGSASASAVRNFTGEAVGVAGNTLFGWVHVVNGTGSASDNTALATDPLTGGLVPPVVTPPVVVPPVVVPPVETPPVETPPAETPPVETPPVETPPVVTPPVEVPAPEVPPVIVRPEDPPVAVPPVVTPPVATPPVVIPPVEVPPVVVPPVVLPPVEVPPIEIPPVVVPPAEPPPAETPPATPSPSTPDDDGTVAVPETPGRPVFTPGPDVQPPASGEAPVVAQPDPPAGPVLPGDGGVVPDLVPRPSLPDLNWLPEPPPGSIPAVGTGSDPAFGSGTPSFGDIAENWVRS